MDIKPIGPPIEIKPPFTMTLLKPNGDVWVHRVDADGKPAGGEYNGVHYDSIEELFAR